MFEKLDTQPKPKSGTYKADLVEVRGVVNKSGYPAYVVTCVIKEEPYKDRKLFFTYSIAKRGLPKNSEEILEFKPIEATIKVVEAIYDGCIFFAVRDVRVNDS
jgi:hypothetical protein